MVKETDCVYVSEEERDGSPVCCWWAWEVGQSLWKTVGSFLDPFSLQSVNPREMKTHVSTDACP